MTGDERDPYSSIEPSRRDFVKKMLGVAFVAPVIGSFGLEELASASASGPPTQYHPNQHHDDDDHDHHDHGHDHDHDGDND
jgi:ABC-type Zn2+ transport system substrate-binding protein/surface adhesin